MFETATVLTVMAAAFGYVNHKTIHLPFAIAIMIGGLLASLSVFVIDAIVPAWGLLHTIESAVAGVNFPAALLHGMLGFLLFAGALHVDVGRLMARGRSIFTLASVGVLLSTAIIGFGSYFLFKLSGQPISLAYCLVFGSLISPTDPVAVLGIMKAANAPEEQEVTIVGESLFNDGVGVLVFTVLVAIAAGASGHGSESMTVGHIAFVLLEEVGGGLLLGLGAGYLTYLAMRSLDEPHLEVLMSVGLVMLITTVALRLHFSAPLGCVVAGLFIGNTGRMFAMSKRTEATLDLIWEFIDEALNAVLFLLVGLEVLLLSEMSLTTSVILCAVGAVPLALLARFVSVSIPILAVGRREGLERDAIPVLTWGGLKGGISIALALSVPAFPGREVLVTATYAVVLFSIIVQGLTVGRLIGHIRRRAELAGVKE